MRLKRFTSLIIVFVLCFVLAACDKKTPVSSDGEKPKTTGSAVEDKTSGAAVIDNPDDGQTKASDSAVQGNDPATQGGIDAPVDPPTPVDPPQPIDPPGAKNKAILMPGISAAEVRWNEEGTKILGPIAPEYDFTEVDEDYFSDALFIGDSRSVGIAHFGKLEGPSYFVKTSMSVYNYSTIEVEEKSTGKTNLSKLLASKTFGKAYIGLGINELGYDLSDTANRFRDLIELLKENNPDIRIYLMANLHVTAARSDTDKTYNNSKLNTMNTMLYNIAEVDVTDNVYYIDVNPVFDDENEELTQEYTNDNTHLFTKYYVMWIDFLKSHAVM